MGSVLSRPLPVLIIIISTVHPLGETSTTLSGNPVTRTRLLYSRGTRGYWSGTMFSGRVIVNVVAAILGDFRMRRREERHLGRLTPICIEVRGVSRKIMTLLN